jgi:Phytanoyl-CoA dioxygenase (PhyH)
MAGAPDPELPDFHRYHRETLPGLLPERGAEAARAARKLGSLALRLPDGGAYTYTPRAGGLDVTPGDAGADTVIELDLGAWQGLVGEVETPPGLLYAGRVRCARGRAMRLVEWEPGLRVLYHGRHLHDPWSARLEDGEGRPLDAEQTFTLPGSDEETDAMARFLAAAGYLFVRGVFPPDEVDALRAEALGLRAEAVKGDKLSWWGRNARGEEVVTRVTRAAARPGLARLPSDPRLLRLVALSEFELVHRRRGSDEEAVSVIYKTPEMAEGLSDLPWHRDCGMGGHAAMCPLMVASVFLEESTPESGELRMLPGSWRGAVPFMDPSHPRAPRGAAFRARPGDVSLHYGDVMHAAPPPTDPHRARYRISATVGFTRPGARHHAGRGQYNDVLHRREDGQIEHLVKVAEKA